MARTPLDADLNIIGRSDLKITLLDGDLNIIQALDDEPNDVDGLSAQELKAKFDESGNIIKDYINNTLIPELLAADATEAQRKANEEKREANEAVRQKNETIRQDQEAAREEQAKALAQELQTQADELSGQLQAAESAREVWEDYDPAKAYQPGNKVYYLGSSYVCRAACTDVLPTVAANWQIIAKKGADSDEGMSPEEADLRYLQLSGGIMTGPLSVMEPAKPQHAAPKSYVDGATYPKAQILGDETRKLLELPEGAVPDDAFKLLGGRKQYTWVKLHLTLSNESDTSILAQSSATYGIAHSKKLFWSGGTFVTLPFQPEVIIPYGASLDELRNALEGQFYIPSFYPPSGNNTANPSWGTGIRLCKSVVSKTLDDNGNYIIALRSQSVSFNLSFPPEFVSSDDPGAYQEELNSDGEYYVKWSVPTNGGLDFARILTFTYTGTGTGNGANSPLAIRFPAVPKIVFIDGTYGNINGTHTIEHVMWLPGVREVYRYSNSNASSYEVKTAYAYAAFQNNDLLLYGYYVTAQSSQQMSAYVCNVKNRSYIVTAIF